MSIACCAEWGRHSQWLLTRLRAAGTAPANFCPWCGKGHTQPAPTSRPSDRFALGSAAIKAENWLPGKPGCRLCKGQGWTLKRVGCCNLEPVVCPCTKVPTTGGQA